MQLFCKTRTSCILFILSAVAFLLTCIAEVVFYFFLSQQVNLYFMCIYEILKRGTGNFFCKVQANDQILLFLPAVIIVVILKTAYIDSERHMAYIKNEFFFINFVMYCSPFFHLLQLSSVLMLSLIN